MLAADNRKAAIKAAQDFADPRVAQFYDPKGQVGKIVAESLGEPGQTAWDIYLFYKASDQWDKELPQPAAWVHQLTGTWIDHYRSGQDLQTELHDIISRLLQA